MPRSRSSQSKAGTTQTGTAKAATGKAGTGKAGTGKATSASQAPVSMQVILRPASTDSSAQPVTQENLSSYLPSQDSVVRATRAFLQAGFQVGTPVGQSFSITAPRRTFEEFFGVHLHDQGAETMVRMADGSTQHELPLKQLPEELAAEVSAVTLTPPPDFGPTSF